MPPAIRESDVTRMTTALFKRPFDAFALLWAVILLVPLVAGPAAGHVRTSVLGHAPSDSHAVLASVSTWSSEPADATSGDDATTLLPDPKLLAPMRWQGGASSFPAIRPPASRFRANLARAPPRA